MSNHFFLLEVDCLHRGSTHEYVPRRSHRPIDRAIGHAHGVVEHPPLCLLSFPAGVSTAMALSAQGQFTYWQPRGVKEYLAASAQNYVGLMEDGQTVLKYPRDKTETNFDCLHEEAARYIRLGPHENLVVYKGFTDDGLLLEYCERGRLDHVAEGPGTLTDTEKISFGKEIVRGLLYLHEHNFIHCDLHIRNVFVTSQMIAKIGDIQGQLSRDDGSIELESMFSENAKSRHPFAGEDEFSLRTDIFALGTLLYHLWHGHEPFPDLHEHFQSDLVQARYRAGQYPFDPSQATDVDIIIGKCWNSSYKHVNEILLDMDHLDVNGAAHTE